MKLTFAPRDVLQIDDAMIIFKNFKGEGGRYNAEGNRNFAILIQDHGNVHIKAPREEGDDPFMYLPVKVKFNGRGPVVYLKSGSNRVKLTEETIACLDDIDIASVDLDIRPYDNEVNKNPHRTAYLQSMCVIQDSDRFSARFAAEEHPED